jgi:hypothetical protein
LGGWGRYPACALVFVSLGATLARALLQIPDQAISLELHEDGRASWRNRAGIWHTGKLGPSQFVSAMAAIVELEGARGRTKRVVMMPDSVSPEDFRRLRVWLRWRRDPARADPE